MEIKQIKETQEHVHSLLDRSRLVEAMDALQPLVNESVQWALRDELEQLRTSYGLMLDYLTGGAVDPQRQQVLERLRASLHTLTDRCVIPLNQSAAYEVIYARRRELEHITLDSIIHDYRTALNRMELLASVPTEQRNDQAIADMLARSEQLEVRLFNKVWSTFPTSAGEAEALMEFVADEHIPSHVKGLVVSALLVGLLSFYDEGKLALLLKIYIGNDDAPVQLRALTAAMLAMDAYTTRVSRSAALATIVDSLKDSPAAAADVAIIQLQLARSRTTESVTRHVRENIIPGIMKLRPDFKKFTGKTPGEIEMIDLEANPEWQEWLDKSGLGKRIEEFGEMQLEGSDVFIATFSHLKSYPFFNTMANWFMPYHEGHSVVRKVLGDKPGGLRAFLGGASFLCNSDRYSFCLSLTSMPQAQSDAMSQQIDANREQMEEMTRTDVPNPSRSRAMIVNAYVQDLYRFFKLFSRRREFKAVFDGAMDFTTLPHLSALTTTPATLALIAELYFKNKLYDDALHYYRLLLEHSTEVNAQVYQKMGFAHQNQGRFHEALDYYGRYELAHDSDLWTLKHMAACHRALKNTAEALRYYSKVEELQPDKAVNAINVGHCLLDMGRHDEAMQHYFKADLMDEKHHRAWRPIAWCSLVQGNYDRATDYYDRIEAHDAPTGIDLLNHGHVELCTGHITEAIALYRRSLHAMDDDAATFSGHFMEDADLLREKGIEASDLPLIIDATIIKKSDQP